MANFSNYLETKIVQWLDGTQLPAPTGSLWVALYSSPGVVQDNAATNLIEIVMTSNSNVAATASHFAVYDAVSAGNLLFHGALSSSVSIAVGDTVKFAANSITLTVQ